MPKNRPFALRTLFCTLLAALVAVVLVGCGGTQAADKPADTNTDNAEATQASGDFNANVMFCGSTSLYPIISSLAGSFTDEYPTWDKVNAEFPEQNVSIYVAPGGSGVGVSALEDGTCDFGMVARTLKDKEKEALGDYKEYQVAKDALTVSVNAKNPIVGKVDSLDTETIAKIFSGEIKTWNELDPSLPAEPIQVFIRDLSGGAYEVFQNTVMGDRTVTESATQSASMTELATNIANNQWGIGYAGFGAYNKANADGQVLVALAVDGVEPSEDTIVSGEYKVQRPVMFVGKGDPTPAQQAFIDYVFSETGEEVVRENGYIPSFTPGKQQ